MPFRVTRLLEPIQLLLGESRVHPLWERKPEGLEKTHTFVENMQTQKTARWVWTRAFLLWGRSADHYTTTQQEGLQMAKKHIVKEKKQLKQDQIDVWNVTQPLVFSPNNYYTGRISLTK